MEKILITCYPRSGSVWLYDVILKHLNKKIAPQSIELTRQSIYTKQDIKNTQYVVRSHCGIIYEIFKPTNQPTAIVHIIRNYKECIIRDCLHPGKIRNFQEEFERVCLTDVPANNWPHDSDYLALIKLFDETKSIKYLIYYEDMITDPIRIFTNLFNFLQIPEKLYEEFLSQYQRHKQDGIEQYDTTFLGSITKGDPSKLLFHSKKHLTPEQRFQWDTEIEQKYPYLFKKYLERYKEKTNE